MTIKDILSGILASALPTCGDIGAAIVNAALAHPEQVNLELENGRAMVSVDVALLARDCGENIRRAQLHLDHNELTGAWLQRCVTFA